MKKVLFAVSLLICTGRLLAAPGAFDLVAPNNGWIPGGIPLFTWQASTGASSYELWIDGVKRPDVITATAFRPNTAIAKGAHTWKVVAVGQGSTNSTSTLEFFVGSAPAHPWEATDGFEGNDISGFVSSGLALSTAGPLSGTYSLSTSQANSPSFSYAYNPGISIEDEEACVSALISFTNKTSRAGVGFADEKGNWVYAMVLPNLGRLAIYQRSAYSYTSLIPAADRPVGVWSETQQDGAYLWYIADKACGTVNTNTKYRLKLFFSRRSRCVLTKLEDANGSLLVQDRVTARVLETPDHPLLAAIATAAGAVTFDDFSIKYPVDKWVFPWKATPGRASYAVNECPSDPILAPVAGQLNYPCGPSNPIAWKWKSADNKDWHIIARSLGGGKTGVLHSQDGMTGFGNVYFPTSFQWIDDVVLCRDPANGRILFLNGGHGNWMYSTPALNFNTWTNVPNWSATANVSNLKGEVIDVQQYPGILAPISLPGNSTTYRYMAFDERYSAGTAGSTTYLSVSNDLQTWSQRQTDLIPAKPTMWSNKYRPVGGNYVMPDGNIMILYCGCTDMGYVGADDAGWNACIVDGKQPWVIKQEGEAGLPLFPIYPGHKSGCNEGGSISWDSRVFHTGPMFATCVVRDTVGGVPHLRMYGGINDQSVGLLVASMAPNFQYYFLKVKGVNTAATACTLNVNVRNIGPTAGSHQVALTVDGTAQNFTTLTLAPYQDSTVQVVVTGAANAAHVVKAGSLSVAFGSGAVGINDRLGPGTIAGGRPEAVKIFDIRGRLVYRGGVVPAERFVNAGSGVYFVKLSARGTSVYSTMLKHSR